MLLPLLLLACLTGPADGTFVGNPGEATTKVAQYGESIVLSEAAARSSSVSATACASLGGSDGLVSEAVVLDLLEGSTVSLPAGSWCSVTLSLEYVQLTGQYDAVDFEITLPGAEVDLYTAALQIDGDRFVLELGEDGWLSADALQELDWGGGPVTVGADDPVAEQLAEALSERSALYRDDGDGEISETERDALPVAVGGGRDEALSQDTGLGEGGDGAPGGCQEVEITEAAAAVLLVLVPGLWRRRQDC